MTTIALNASSAALAASRPFRRGTRTRRMGNAGVAALEFALIAPLLLLIGLGAIDLSRAWLAWRRVVQTAQATAEIETAVAVQIDGSNQTTTSQLSTVSTAIFAIYPSVQSAPTSQYGVAISEVVFTKSPANCTTACTYTANVAWSAPLQGSASARPCGTLSSKSDTSAPSSSTLPADAFGPTSLLVVDVFYNYQPILLNYLTGPVAMHYTAYLPPRSGTIGQWIRYVNSGVGTNCAGWS